MKKLICLLVLFTIVFSVGTVLADAEYEILSPSVLIDGTEYAANILVQKYDDWGEVYIQIAPLARAFGYTVTYVEETDSVIFEKENTHLELCLPDSYEITTDTYIDVISYMDTTYVSYQYVDNIIDSIIPESTDYYYNENASYSFYTEQALINEYKDKLPVYDKLLSAIKTGTYKSTLNSDLTLSYNNDTFGVNINGGLEFKGTANFDNGAFKIDFEMNTKGLLNLFELFKQGETLNYDKTFNPDETINVYLISDGKDVYLKGTLAEMIVSAETPYFIEDEGWEKELKYSETAQKGWIKLDTIESSLSANGIMSSESFVAYVAKTDMDLETKKAILDSTVLLYQYIELSLKETNKGLSYKITLDKDFAETLSDLIPLETPVVSDEFKIVIKEKYNKDLTGTSDISGSIVFDNVIPNDFNIDSGKLTINIESNEVRKPSSEKVTVPDEFVSLKELSEKFDELYNQYWEMSDY